MREREKGKEYEEAIGNIDTIVYTEKSKRIMADEHKILTLFGSTGNGKSMLATLKMLSRIFKSGSRQQTYVLAGRDITTLEKRFVKSNYSVLNWKPFRGKWVYKKQVDGGSQVIFTTKTGRKYLYFTPFNNVNTYTRILGQTIDGVFVDEAVEANEDFLQEIVSRTIRTKATWLIMTSNGGDPKHYFYTGIVNRSHTLEDYMSREEMESLGIRPTPNDELRYFESERKDIFMAYHMGLEDNPVYTPERLKQFYELFPLGSFMYYSRVLGIRGFQQDSPFAPYINETTFTNYNKLRDVDSKFYPNKMVFSVDSGGHVFSSKEMIGSRYKEGDYGTEKGGHTIMLTGAFDEQYRNFILLDTYFPNEMIQWASVEKINNRVRDMAQVFNTAKRDYMFCDPADSTLLAGLMSSVRNVNDIRPAIKRDNKLALDEKVIISVIQQFMMQGRFKILDTLENRKWFYGAMIGAKQESDGKIFDNGSWEADVWDALKYIFMSMYRLLIT